MVWPERSCACHDPSALAGSGSEGGFSPSSWVIASTYPIGARSAMRHPIAFRASRGSRSAADATKAPSRPIFRNARSSQPTVASFDRHDVVDGYRRGVVAPRRAHKRCDRCDVACRSWPRQEGIWFRPRRIVLNILVGSLILT